MFGSGGMLGPLVRRRPCQGASNYGVCTEEVLVQKWTIALMGRVNVTVHKEGGTPNILLTL